MIYNWCLQIFFYFNDNLNRIIKAFFVFMAATRRELMSLKNSKGWGLFIQNGSFYLFIYFFLEWQFLMSHPGDETFFFSTYWRCLAWLYILLILVIILNSRYLPKKIQKRWKDLELSMRFESDFNYNDLKFVLSSYSLVILKCLYWVKHAIKHEELQDWFIRYSFKKLSIKIINV